MFTRLINPDKPFEEIDAMIKSVLNASFIYQSENLEKISLVEQLNLKYKPLETCDIRSRIENFILWSKNVCDFMTSQDIPDHRSLEKYLSISGFGNMIMTAGATPISTVSATPISTVGRNVYKFKKLN